MSLLDALVADLVALSAEPLTPLEVAVVDSGIDGTHPDLAGRVHAAFAVESVEGTPQVREVSPRENNDRFGHGTAVASIIARFAPHVRLIDVRVLDATNASTGETLLCGMRHAIDRRPGPTQLGTRVLNMSLASKSTLASRLHELCELAYRRNQVVVAAKRNMPLSDQGYPAELSSTISVDRGTFDAPHTLRFRENEVIEFVAHGEKVAVAAAGGGYTTMTGTSFATGLLSLTVMSSSPTVAFRTSSEKCAFASAILNLATCLSRRVLLVALYDHGLAGQDLAS